MSSLNVSGITTISNHTTINGISNVSGNSTFKNDTTFLSTSNVSGFITLKNNTIINGKVNIKTSNAFFSTAAVDAGMFVNTYLNFKYAGGGNDLCYLRQIGVR